MGITRIQTATGTDNDQIGGTSVSATWGTTTTAGNLLIAILGHNLLPGTYTAPAGWVQVGSTTTNGVSTALSMWYYPNAPSQSSTGNWTYTSCHSTVLIVAEYSGVVLSSPEDGLGNHSTGTSSSPATGSQTTISANDLLVGGLAQTLSGVGSITYSSPLNSFVIVVQVQATNAGNSKVEVALLERIVTSAGTYSSGATSTQSTAWCGDIAAFQGSPPSVNLIKPRVHATPFNPALYE